MIPYREEGALLPYIINRWGFKLALWKGDRTKLGGVVTIPISTPYTRDADDFDTGDLVRERVIKYLYLRFRWRAKHVLGNRWNLGRGTGYYRLNLISILKEYGA